MRNWLSVGLGAAFVALLLSTGSVKALPVESTSAVAIDGSELQASWTWTDAGTTAAEWAVGSGAVAGGYTAVFGTPAAVPAAAVCAVAGAVGGFGAYAVRQGWHALFGDLTAASALPANALD
jgi:hypothetical protein